MQRERGKVTGVGVHIIYICLYVCGQNFFFIPHAQRERGEVIGVGIYTYIYVCVCVFICLWTKKILNRTLAIDSLFKLSR